jgi:hypothetical protein
LGRLLRLLVQLVLVASEEPAVMVERQVVELLVQVDLVQMVVRAVLEAMLTLEVYWEVTTLH